MALNLKPILARTINWHFLTQEQYSDPEKKLSTFLKNSPYDIQWISLVLLLWLSLKQNSMIKCGIPGTI